MHWRYRVGKEGVEDHPSSAQEMAVATTVLAAKNAGKVQPVCRFCGTSRCAILPSCEQEVLRMLRTFTASLKTFTVLK
jgi:hypothetical protein